VLAAITKAGILRAQVRVWTAHYLAGKHICSRSACGAKGFEADATQWAGYPGGGSPGHYDITLAQDTFLIAAPTPVDHKEPELLLINNTLTYKAGDKRGEWSILSGAGRRHIGGGELASYQACGVPVKALTDAQYKAFVVVGAA